MNKTRFIRFLYRFYLLQIRKSSITDFAGFTLLEILIVVIIIGILAVIAISNYLQTIDKFRYGEAKIQMSCIAKELTAFRMEKGYFPADQGEDVAPAGIDCFQVQASGKVPFSSKYDYDLQVIGANYCYVQIVFLGKNLEKETPNNSATIYSTPGIYEYSQIQADSDDLVLSLGINPMGSSC